MSRTVSALLASAGAAALLAHPALAQDDDRSTVERLSGDVITVTGTKKKDAENVQDVPLSVSAFNEDTLEALKVRTLQDLSFNAPNVSLDDIGTARGSANFSIRGLGINSSIPSIDATVGVFVDGVYMGVTSGLVFDVFDVGSVEVLRGPQGILFGRNTTGGAVLLNTSDPTDEFSYSFRAALETPVDDDRGGVNTFLQGRVSGPIIEDKLNGKIAVYRNDDQGYFVNQFTGDNQGAAETTIVRAALEFLPTDNLRSVLKGEYFETDGDGPTGQNRGDFDRESFDFAIDEPGFIEAESVFLTLKTELDVAFGDGQITSILGYRDYEQETLADIDATPFFLFHSPTRLEQEQFSSELRYNGTFGKADVTVGSFVFNQELGYDETRFLPPLTAAPFPGGGKQDHTVIGVFGTVDYSVTDKLIATVGLRYTYEEKEAEIAFVIPRAGLCSVIDDTCPDDVDDSNTWENFAPKIGLQYFFTDETQAYGSWTRGFRSGGYNFRITDPTLFQQQLALTGEPSFDEETVDSFEIGLKTTTPDGRGRINLAGFFTQIQDLQREINISGGPASVNQFILNTADADIYGFEFDGQYALTDNLLIMANVGIIEAEYTEVNFDISNDGVIDGFDETLALPRVPDLTYGGSIIYDLPLGAAGDLTSRVQFQHRDEVAFTDSNLGWLNAADMLFADLTWSTPIDGVAFSIYGRNLLDEATAGNDTQLGFTSGTPFGQPGEFSNGVNQPFDPNPAAGTFSPLNRGRVLGFEITINN